MERNAVRAGPRKFFDVLLRVQQHQMHVERHVRQRPQRRDHIRSKADIRHKIAVHNVEMQPVRILHRPQAITHPRVVAREHRGSYFHFLSPVSSRAVRGLPRRLRGAAAHLLKTRGPPALLRAERRAFPFPSNPGFSAGHKSTCTSTAISGIVITESAVVTATLFEASSASLPYCTAKSTQFAATGVAP